MKVHEVITQLQNFDMNLDVKCYHESTDWCYDEDLEQSVEIDSIAEGPVAEIALIHQDVFTTYVMIK